MKKLLVMTVLSVCCSRAEFIVAPNDRATQSGNTLTIGGFTSPATFQNVYGSGNFSGPVLIHGIAFRSNEGEGGSSFDATIPRITIRMSTYIGTYSSFDRFSYDANKGADDITAFDAAVHWITTDLAGSGPNPFDLKLQFSQPFAYNPANGNLLINYQSSGPFSGGVVVDSHGHGDPTVGWFGGNSLGNLVTQFEVTSIPEPSTSVLTMAVVVVLAFVRKRS